MLNRFPLAAIAAALVLTACGGPAGPANEVPVASAPPPTVPAPTAPVAPPPENDVVAKSCVDANTVMEARMALLGPAETRQVLVTFKGKGAPSSTQLAQLKALGLGGVFMRKLPIAR